MQNTSRIQSVPTTLINNFFIAGISQETLIQRVKENKAFRIPPEVLFHMYNTSDHIASYLQFVFPQNVTVEYRAQDPRYFSFMMTDAGGFNSFFHVLIFHEEINEAEISSEDFDIIVNMWKKQQEKEAAKKLQIRKRKESNLEIINEADKKAKDDKNDVPQTPTPHSQMMSDKEMLIRRATRIDKRRPIKTAETLMKERLPDLPEQDESADDTMEKSKDVGDFTSASKHITPSAAHEESKHSAISGHNMSALHRTITPQSTNTPDQNSKSHTGVHKSSNTDQKDKGRKKAEEIQKRRKDKDAGMKRVMNEFKHTVEKHCKKVYNEAKNVLHNELQNLNAFNSSGLIQAPLLHDEGRNRSVIGAVSAVSAVTNQIHRNISTAAGIGVRKLLDNSPQSEEPTKLHSLQQQQQHDLNENLRIAQSSMTDENKQSFSIVRESENAKIVIDEGYMDTQGVTTGTKNQSVMLKEHQQFFEDIFSQEKKHALAQAESGRPQQTLEEISEDLNSSHEGIAFNEDLYKKKRYVPVALVLETETEYHDVFRQILLALFDLIRVPPETVCIPASGPTALPQCTIAQKFYMDNPHLNPLKEHYNEKIIQSRNIAFADLVAHVAFLKTIPAPSFNSIYHIHMLPIINNQGQSPGLHTFTIREGGFDEIPSRSLTPIKVLFDVLDVKSIIYCWKALLFDKSLILVSSQYSLQFYVAEALKQLLFPMTWQNSYIQPGNESLLGHADGFMPVIYGSNSSTAGFDFFDGLSPEMAVCDIDACFTNHIDLPTLPSEHMYIRILNTLKNSKIGNYDKAYPPAQVQKLEGSVVSTHGQTNQGSEEFVGQVRETFFSLLKPYFIKIEDYIDKKVKSNGAFFENYFFKKEYTSHFEALSEQHHAFAKALVESSQFIHFCDDYFTDLAAGGAGELNNFQMFKAIIASRLGDQSAPENDKGHPSSLHRDQTFQNLEAIRLRTLVKTQSQNSGKQKPRWPDSTPVVFNFRMPADTQKAMLFERIHFMIEEIMQKKQQDVTRNTNKDILANRSELKYAELISDIRRAFFSGLSRCKSSSHSGNGSHEGGTTTNGGNKKQYQSAMKNRTPMAESSISSMMYTADRGSAASMILTMTELKFQAQNAGFPQMSLKRQSSNNDVAKIASTGLRQPSNLLPVSEGLPEIEQNPAAQSQQSSSAIEPSILQPPVAGTHGFFYEQEYKRVRMCHKKISRLMYGRNGLILFLCTLFAFFEESQRLEAVNYYWALREQLEEMECYEKAQRKQCKERAQNRSISEESNEDEEDKNKPESFGMAFGGQAVQPPVEQMMQSKESLGKNQISQQPRSSQASNRQSVQSAPSAYRNERDWFSINEWIGNDSSTCQKLRRSQQFVLFKTKLYEAFECTEDGQSLIWVELFKMFPCETGVPKTMQLFPYVRFFSIWDSLTKSQQEEWFVKYGQRLSTPQIQLITKDYVKSHSTSVSEGSSSRTFKSDETLFYGATIKKTWIDKRNEARLKKERQQSIPLDPTEQFQSSFNTNSLIPSTPVPHSKQSEICQDKLSMSKKAISQSYASDDLFKNSVKSKIAKKQDDISKSGSIKESSGKKSGGLLSLLGFKKDKNTRRGSTDCSTQVKTFEEEKQSQQQQQYVELHHTPHHNNSSKVISGENGGSLSSYKFPHGCETPPNQHSSKSLTDHSSMNKLSKIDVGVSYEMRKEGSSRAIVDKPQTKPQTLENPEKVGERLIVKIQEFWKSFAQHIDKKGKFKEDILPQAVEKLQEFDRYINYLKNRLYFKPLPEDIAFHNSSVEEALSSMKQAFFLNLFNFLVLYQLAVLMVSNPEAIEKLQSYNMWQSFLDNTSIILSGQKIKAYCIMHTILRNKLHPPAQLSKFLLTNGLTEPCSSKFSTRVNSQSSSSQSGEGSNTDGIKDFIILKPHSLISFGFFFPVRNSPHLVKYFTCRNLDSALQEVTSDYITRNFSIRDDYNLIVLPKMLKWFKNDLINGAKLGEEELKYDEKIKLILAVDKLVFNMTRKSQYKQSPFERILHKHATKNLNVDDIQMIYSQFCWQFRPNELSQLVFPQWKVSNQVMTGPSDMDFNNVSAQTESNFKHLQ